LVEKDKPIPVRGKLTKLLPSPCDVYGYRDSWRKSSAACGYWLESRCRLPSAFPDYKTSKI